MKPVSELRLDLVSNDWVVIATGRAKRPETFKEHKREKESVPPEECPFCNPNIIKQGVRYRINNPDGSWRVLVVDNKYPAFAKNGTPKIKKNGVNRTIDGIGFHEIIITQDHIKQLALFSNEQVKEVIDAYQSRYLSLMKYKFIKYIAIFHNHGKEAGASVAHPHSQLIAIPVIDPDLKWSIEGATRYFKRTKKCVYCTMIEQDKKDGRVIYENEKFLVLSPFAPIVSFETRVYPKEHKPYFEKMTEEEKILFADALRVALYKLYKGLDDPAYNFYIHTSPCDNKDYSHYHWHLNILPKTATWAGFELGTGIEISTIQPEKAAEFLRKAK